VDFAYYTTTEPVQWEEWAGRNVAVREGGIALETEPTVDHHDLGFDAVDIVINRDGTIYALRPSGDVYRYDRQQQAASVWTNGDGETVDDPQSICLAGDRLFVADGADASLVVVSEREHRTIGRIETDVEELRTLVTGDRKVYILDSADGRIATLQRHGAVQTAIRGLESPRDLTVDPGGNVSVLEMTDEGPIVSVYEAKYVASPDTFPYRRTIEDFETDTEHGSLVPRSIEAVTEGEVIVHGPLSASGDPATFHYRLGADGAVFERRNRLDVLCARLRAGPQRGRARYPTYYGVAADGNRVYAIEETKRYRRNEYTERFSGTAYRRFDAGSIDTQWHRLTLGLDDLDSNTQVLVSYAASDENRRSAGGVEAVEGVNEHDAADLRAAGIESVWDLVESDPGTLADTADGATVERATTWITEAVAILEERSETWRDVEDANPTDVLLDGATGRYLHVCIEIVGDAETSPTVGSFRAYCPRQTYLRYLPDLYREDRRGERFLAQFLSVFESAYANLEEDIEGLSQYFDPYGVPSEYLDWLEQWLALETPGAWPESARREFLDRAPELFKQRGTRSGLESYVDLYLSHVTAPDTGWITDWQRRRVEERRAAGHLTEEAATERLDAIEARANDDNGGHHLFVLERRDLDGIETGAARAPYTMHMPSPRSFAVFVGPFMDPKHRSVVESIVAEEKPAHTEGHVVPMRQHVKLEGNSFLGINTTLTPRNFVLGRATLGEDSVLKERNLL
jgi:phage tail-like protein